MKINLSNGRAAMPEDIEALEALVGGSLGEFGEFVLNNDGAEPSSNHFVIAEIGSGVDEFIPVREIEKVLELIPDFPGVPIARAPGGDYIYLNLEDGGVYFWDHEQIDGNYKIANGFYSFLEVLEPFDEDSVGPPEVESVWIDPEFRKQNPHLFKR